MFEEAARLQAHNQEMVKCISQLRSQKQKMAEKVASQQQERVQLENEIAKLQQQLAALDESLERNRQKLHEQECKLTETESGYSKVVDTLHMLLMSAKKDEKVHSSDDLPKRK
ncbi:microtubule nucleation factor SSNA1-like [Toxorhynchites rutilus septentrionalis]|uniref:microtubule nucleation factor SSNA1-like n=1 Tax=Toxorhynchites rutilus septentrionalis TaxID=329112 RepID=UPI0024792C6C|nr:microtubule nucleation factor SSNA1-like [Toxorhynchites rutilus septentrionalis]